MRPFHQEITKARGQNSHPSCTKKKFLNRKKRAVRKLEKITRQVAALKAEKRKVSEVNATNNTDADNEDDNEDENLAQAGTAFGGGKSRTKKG